MLRLQEYIIFSVFQKCSKSENPGRVRVLLGSKKCGVHLITVLMQFYFLVTIFHIYQCYESKLKSDSKSLLLS